MKIPDGFIIREVAGNHIAVATGEASKKFNCMITVNGSGKILFETLQKGAERNELVDVLLNTYEVQRDVAERDVDKFIAKLGKKNELTSILLHTFLLIYLTD